MKKAGKIIIGAIVLCALGGLVFTRLNKKEEPIEAVPDPTVQIQAPVAGNIELSTGLTGTVEPADQVSVIPKLAGEVLEVYVSQGQTVAKNQAMFKIDNKQLDAARISLDSASVSLQNAQTNLNRMQVLYDSGDISAQNYESAVNSVSLAQLQYDSAKLNYDTQAEYTVVKAPIAGTLDQFDIEAHDMVSSAAPAGVITGEGGKSVSFYVSERVRNGLSMGDVIDVEKNGTEYSGMITEIGSMVDAATGLFKVKAAMNEADALAAGTKVKLYVTDQKAENVMTIPVDCVSYSGGDAYVYTYDSSTKTAKKKAVEEGLIDAEKVEITSGLSWDDQVIVTWTKELYDGAAVNVESADAEQTTAAESESVTEQETGTESAGGQ